MLSKLIIKLKFIPEEINTNLYFFDYLVEINFSKDLLLGFKINDPSYLYLIDEDPTFIIILEELLTKELLNNIIEFDLYEFGVIERDKIEDIYEKFYLLDLFYQETIYDMMGEDKKYLLEKALRLNNYNDINELIEYLNQEELIEVSRNYPKLLLYLNNPNLILSRNHAIIFITKRKKNN